MHLFNRNRLVFITSFLIIYLPNCLAEDVVTAEEATAVQTEIVQEELIQEDVTGQVANIDEAVNTNEVTEIVEEAELPCVAIAPPKAQLGQSTGQDIAVPVQNMLVSYLSGPMLRVVPLQSRLPAQLKAEAKQLGCEQMLVTNVKYKKKKNFGKAFSIGAGVLSSVIPYAGGSVGSYVATATAANVANSAANAQMQQEAMESISAAQGNVRKGDFIFLDYELKQVGKKKAIAKNKFDAKASEDGEDLLLPLIEEASGEIFTKLTE